ncbi:MAG: aspartate aminotransferase family protein [Xanthomonadaceae bacterium]|nr:aspartate aminotransferase family protein [Xanthomonadaceae bacterium]
MSDATKPMDADAFRDWGHQLIDWIADYHAGIASRPVQSTVQPGEVRAQLPPHAPEEPEPFDRILADFERVVMPGITHWQSPHWHAYFPANASFPSILGELLSAGLGVQGMLWQTSPACTELETHVLDWTAELLGLPAAFQSSGPGGGVLQDTASSAVLCAMLAARERATGGRTNREGCDGTLVAYTSEQAHSMVEKAAGIAGIGRAHLRLIPTDNTHAMRADALATQVAADRADGLVPFFASATVGTTASNAIDPVGAIAAVCRDAGMWLHVDAAMSGTAALCPEFRWIHAGVEHADSYSFNPHKWMLTNFDCSAFWVADRRWLLEALSILPEYLRNQATDTGAVIDYRDWQVPLGRRFRALKLWFVLRSYGAEALRAMVREHVRLAQDFAQRVERHPLLELAAPAPLNLVCFRLKDRDDAANRALLERLNASGALALSHAAVGGCYTLRFCVGQAKTTAAHVDAAWERIVEEAQH